MSQRTVMPYSATPPKPAMARSPRSSRSASTSRTAAKGRRAPSADTPDCIGRQRLDLEAVDADDRVAVVHQVMREVEARRAQPHHQHGAAGRGTRDRPAQVERVPARQQRIDLEAPRQAEHVLQGAGLDLRDVDRFLLLVDAGLHAVVADAMPGRRHQRIVDRGHGERADGEALALQQVHLRDLFLERAAGQASRRTATSGRRRSCGP